MFALTARFALEAEAEPREIVEHGGFILRLAPLAVEVFNAQEQTAPKRRGGVRVAESGIGVAEMQRAVRRWSETQDSLRRKCVGGHDGNASA